MTDRQTIELTMLELARQSGEPLDAHTFYTVRNAVRDVMAAKERHHKRMTSPAYEWKRPVSPRR